MSLTLEAFTAAMTDYVQKLNNNNSATIAEVNRLAALIEASSGDGALLLLDLWDRDGLVGSHSYVLDLDNYPGGATITIGRRPAPTGQEVNISVAWATYAGSKQRVLQSGDVVLNAAGIITGLPKTIYVGIPSGGTAQLYEDTVTPNVLYAYSMTWDGFSLSELKRLAHILPAYTTLQKIAGSPQLIQIFDSETDWVSDTISSTEIVLPGAADDNDIGFDGSLEVLGFFVHASKKDDDGMNAPVGNPPDSVVKFKVMSEAIAWSDDFELDCGNIPDSIFLPVKTSNVGDDRFVREVQHFTLERTSLGSSVTSARAFTWGVVVRPIIGIAIPKDNNEVTLI